MRTRLPFIILLALAPISSAAAQGRGSLPIAYVSMQRISTQTTEAKAAASSLEKLREERGAQLAAQQRAVDAAHQRVVNAGGIFGMFKRAQLQADESRERAELQRLSQQAQTDFQSLQRQLQTKVVQKIAEILTDIARRRNLQMVLNQDTAVVWSLGGADLTGEVIDRLNQDAQAASK